MKTTISKLTNKQLAIQMQTGTKDELQSAYNELYKRYKDKIFFTIFRALNFLNKEETAKDLTQNVFLKVFKNIHSYNPQVADISTWMYTIAHNEIIDHKRVNSQFVLSYDAMADVKGKNGDMVSKDLFQPVSTDKAPDKVMMDEQKTLAVRNAIDRAIKSEKLRQAFVLKHIEELSHEEICEKLDMPLGSVKSSINRAKDLFKDYMLKHHKEIVS